MPFLKKAQSVELVMSKAKDSKVWSVLIWLDMALGWFN
jgi:hypothetical protein